jgi:hypothetical protein
MCEPDYDAIEKEMREQPDAYFIERMSEQFKNKKANEVPYLMDIANMCLDSYSEIEGLSFHFTAKFIGILGELHGRYIQSAKEKNRPPLDRQAMIDEAYWLLKKEQFISNSISHIYHDTILNTTNLLE